jgi:hypothetical protein
LCGELIGPKRLHDARVMCHNLLACNGRELNSAD